MPRNNMTLIIKHPQLDCATVVVSVLNNTAFVGSNQTSSTLSCWHLVQCCETPVGKSWILAHASCLGFLGLEGFPLSIKWKSFWKSWKIS
jgi:hypothetical protein